MGAHSTGKQRAAYHTVLTIGIKTCWDSENKTHPEDWCCKSLACPRSSWSQGGVYTNYPRISSHFCSSGNACEQVPECKAQDTSDCGAPAGSTRSLPAALESGEAGLSWTELEKWQSRDGEVKVGIEGAAGM